MNNNKIILLILDGWGFSKKIYGNAFRLSKINFFSYLINNYPNCLCQSSGSFVGLPHSQIGNSEVGHLVIGSGRCVLQNLTNINNEIENKNFYDNLCLKMLFQHLLVSNGSLHLIGLFSNGGVHSSLEHLKALLKVCLNYNFKNVYIHAFLDGRDVSFDSGLYLIEDFEKYLDKIGIGTIVTLIGRFYAMDRDSRWERTKIAYDSLTSYSKIKNVIYSQNLIESLKNQYRLNIYDEFISPIIYTNKYGVPLNRIDENDSVIFFNFRADRAKQLTKAFVDVNFHAFERNFIKNLNFVCMTNYSHEFNVPVIYENIYLKNTVCEVISNKGLKQLKIAETEKYSHVTSFFNGGTEKPFVNEDRILIPSKRVCTYDLNPEMSANEITSELINNIKKQIYSLITVNFANMDMVGHTGKLNSGIKAVELLDILLSKIYIASIETNSILLITSDHGNIECMLNPDGSTNTSHTSNPVQFIYINPKQNLNKNIFLKKNNTLCDIAPTILKLLDIKKPKEMTGSSLL